MNVNVWMPSGQPIKRQMKKRPLQHKTRTLSNPITFAWDQGDVVGENDNWKSKITCNKYTVLYSVQKTAYSWKKNDQQQWSLMYVSTS